jgi:hypothetical protein
MLFFFEQLWSATSRRNTDDPTVHETGSIPVSAVCIVYPAGATRWLREHATLSTTARMDYAVVQVHADTVQIAVQTGSIFA